MRTLPKVFSGGEDQGAWHFGLYVHVYGFLAWERTTGANILPRVSKSEKRKRKVSDDKTATF